MRYNYRDVDVLICLQAGSRGRAAAWEAEMAEVHKRTKAIANDPSRRRRCPNPKPLTLVN